MSLLLRRVLALAAFAVCTVVATAWAQDRSLGAVDGLFPRAQAERGGQLFAAQCSSCHDAAEAAGYMFERNPGAVLGDYHAKLGQLMPPSGTVRPSPQGYLDIIAFLAATRGAAAGQTDQRIDAVSWRAARLPAATTAVAAAPKAASPASVEWRSWRSDAGATAYSTADQITPANVAKLKVAWRWSGANYGPTPEGRNITTPLMAEGKLYATVGMTRNVVAIDPATGETLWQWRPQETPERYANAPRKGAGRGVAFWSDGKQSRVFTVTPGFSLVSLDAKTGQADARFGDAGKVDLMVGLRNLPKTGLADIGSQSPPLVIGDVVAVGPAHRAGLRAPSAYNVKGDVRGYDAHTGKLLWTFHTIPQKGEPGYETWLNGSAEFSGNAGAWAPMTADPRTGAIFVPVEGSTSDLYGGARPGANENATSLVSLDAKTGKVRWKHQLVHHDMWDWDLPAAPILTDIPQPGGGVRHAVVQLTKFASVFVFDRDTGEPLWPIVERPVPPSDVPGEVAFPTQPMPTKPLPIDRQGISVDDLIDFTPQLRTEALAVIKPYRLGVFMQPASLANATDGTKGTLSLPSYDGGANWEGGAYDPMTGLLYVASTTDVQLLALVPGREGSDMRYVTGGGAAPVVRGIPIVKPPWGRITAIDLKTGDHAWMIANADTPKEIADNPALKGLKIPRTGINSHSGLLATKTLLFAGEGDDGGPTFRAHDKGTGKILAEIKLPGTQQGLPMTYVVNGRQYIVMTVAEPGKPAEIVALALPN